MNEKNKKQGFVETFEENLLFLRKLLFSIPNGLALHRILLDQNNKPVDYIFLEVNESFEMLTGLQRAKIIGKRVTEILPGTENDKSNWIGTYGKVAMTGEAKTFESYSENLNKWYRVMATCPEKGFFMTIFEDITDRKKATEERERLIQELQEALAEIKSLRGILPLCSFCKKNRNDKGYWEQVDMYIHKYLQADISHSVCPDCLKKHYPEAYEIIRAEKNEK